MVKHFKAKKDPVNEKINLLKKKPGFVFAVVFFVILLIIVVVLTYTRTSNPVEEGAYARFLHENNKGVIDYQLELVGAQVSGQYTYAFEDDLIYSTIDDYNWIKKKEEQLYKSKPSNEVLMKEYAVSYFLGELYVVETLANYEEYSFLDKEATITEAINIEFVSKKTFSSDINELFEGEPQRRAVFEKTYNELIKEYINTKKVLLNSGAGEERKLVEAKKAILMASDNTAYLNEE